MLVQVVEPVVRSVEQRAQLREPARDSLLRDGEELLLGAIDRGVDIGGLFVSDTRDPPGGTDEVPEDRLALDEFVRSRRS